MSEKLALKDFDKVNNSYNDTSEAEALELLSQLPNPATVRDEEEWTLLHHACYNGWYEVVKVLIEKYNCDTKCVVRRHTWPYRGGGTLLHCASLGGHLKLIKYLIEEKHCDTAVTNKQSLWTVDNGWTPLHSASSNGHLDVLKYFVEDLECDPSCKNEYGKTPLFYACQHGHLAIVRYLINCDPLSPENYGEVICAACRNGHLDIIKYLIEEKPHCDPLSPEDCGWAIHAACGNGHLDVIKYLIEEKHCDPLSPVDYGWTTVHAACENGHLDVIKYLIEEKHCDPLSLVDYGQAIRAACRNGHLDVIKYVIEEKHCDPLSPNNYGRTTVHAACENGHLKVIKYLIEKQHCDSSCRNDGGRTPLHIASSRGHLDVVKYFIEDLKCDPSCKDKDGHTPLYDACLKGLPHFIIINYLIEEKHCDPINPAYYGWEMCPAYGNGHLDIIKYLIGEKHCDLLNPEYYGQAICAACFDGHLNITKYLIKMKHCDPEYYGRAIRAACTNGHLDVIKYLIEEKHCDPLSPKENGWTTVHAACVNGHLNVIKYLLEKQHCDSPCRNNDGVRTPLHIASSCGHLDVVKYFIEDLKCDPSCKDKDGHTPLYDACLKGWPHFTIMKYLIEEKHCDPLSPEDYGQVIYYAARFVGHLKDIKYLIEKQHCDLSYRNDDGKTPLHSASSCGHLNAVKYFIEDLECDPSCKDKDGQTPLYDACLRGHLTTIKYFIEEKHCDPLSPKNYGWTTVHAACVDGHLNVIKYLIEDQHCDLSCRNEGGKTPLHSASSNGHLDVVKYFIEDLECDPSCKDKDGRTPLYDACFSGQLAIIRYFIEHCHCEPLSIRYPFSTVHAACANGHLDVIKYLIEDQQCSPDWQRTDNSPLQLACEKGHLEVVKYLIEKQHCTSNLNEYVPTPLCLACYSNNLNLVVYLVNECKCNPLVSRFQMDQEFVKNHTDIAVFLMSSCDKGFSDAQSRTLLFHPAFKVFVVGNSSSGKSTLTKTIQFHFQQNWLTMQMKRLTGSKVNGVEPYSSGIIPVPIQSSALGHTIMYDFAGQPEFYSSHAALWGHLQSSQGTLVFIVIDISKSEKDIISELRYWSFFVNNQFSKSSQNPSIMLIASHGDIAKENGESPDQKARQLLQIVFERQELTFVTLDCRLESSLGLQEVCATVSKHSSSYHKEVNINTQVHFLKHLIRKNFCSQKAVQLHEVLTLVKDSKNDYLRNSNLIPASTEELCQQISTLSDSGELLYLKNCHNIGKSWIVLSQEDILREINGTIFSPQNFKCYCNISNNTGVVPLSNIRKIFPSYNHQMVADIMEHFEFCHEIKMSEAKLISDSEMNPMDSETYYFFPALVNIERPNEIICLRDSHYRSGWCLRCIQHHQVFISQFLHTLLFRLAFRFVLKCVTQNPSIVIQRLCSIWKSGIHWQNDGVEAIVEIVEQSTAVVVVVRCWEETDSFKCIKLRSAIIQTILRTQQELVGALSVEERLIPPEELASYPLEPMNSLFTYSISQAAQAVSKRMNAITDTCRSELRTMSFHGLLHFEPYSCLSYELILQLYDEHTANTEVSDAFLHDCAKTAFQKREQLKSILLLPEHESEFHGALWQCHDQYSDDPIFQCYELFRTWKKFTEEQTYSGLRRVMDKYSIFCGRNPLVSWITTTVYPTQTYFIFIFLSRILSLIDINLSHVSSQ